MQHPKDRLELAKLDEAYHIRPMASLSLTDSSQLTSDSQHLGNTAVIAAMYGPVEVKLQKISIEKASVEAVYHPKSGAPLNQIFSKSEEVNNWLTDKTMLCLT
uniref:Uncharacterized protein n=1 Tax=Timema poppense TaxID=170557 RepID=A0A7R9D872_TIMPO|nr:unnamed protein product [Timema poppensis]